MILVVDVPGHVEAALLSDEEARFGASINPMLQKLFENWRPGGRSLGASLTTSGVLPQRVSAPVVPLYSYSLPDGSAVVMLAEGWHVNPQSGGGTILAQGPRGETLALGFPTWPGP